MSLSTDILILRSRNSSVSRINYYSDLQKLRINCDACRFGRHRDHRDITSDFRFTLSASNCLRKSLRKHRRPGCLLDLILSNVLCPLTSIPLKNHFSLFYLIFWLDSFVSVSWQLRSISCFEEIRVLHSKAHPSIIKCKVVSSANRPEGKVRNYLLKVQCYSETRAHSFQHFHLFQWIEQRQSAGVLWISSVPAIQTLLGVPWYLFI